MSVLDDVRGLESRVASRMQELRPLVDEYHELEAVAQRLGLNVEAAPAAPVASRTRSRRTSTARATASRSATSARRASARRTTRRKGAKRGPIAPAGQRQEQLLALVKSRPGITVRQIGNELGVDPTSLYRIVRALENEGTIKKENGELTLT